MKRQWPLVAAALLMLGVTAAVAQEKDDEPGNAYQAVGPGMDERKINDATVIMPEGTKVYKHENVYTYETTEAYTTRRLLKDEGRILDLEREVKDLKERLGAMRAILEEMKKEILKKEAGGN